MGRGEDNVGKAQVSQGAHQQDGAEHCEGGSSGEYEGSIGEGCPIHTGSEGESLHIPPPH